MILVTVGTSTEPFDRLLEGVEQLAEREEVVVQHGASEVRPAGARCVAFLSYDELLDCMREARAVVTHAGVGSIMAALSAGKRPVVLPRLRARGEAVDDHQLELATRLEQAGLVQVVKSDESIGDALAHMPPLASRQDGGRNPLADELREYLLACTRPRAWVSSTRTLA